MAGSSDCLERSLLVAHYLITPFGSLILSLALIMTCTLQSALANGSVTWLPLIATPNVLRINQIRQTTMVVPGSAFPGPIIGDLQNTSAQSVTHIKVEARAVDKANSIVAVLTATTYLSSALPGQLVPFAVGPFTFTLQPTYTLMVRVASYDIAAGTGLTQPTIVDVMTNSLKVVLRNDTGHSLTDVHAIMWSTDELYVTFPQLDDFAASWDRNLAPGEVITIPFTTYPLNCFCKPNIRVAAQGTISDSTRVTSLNE